jgi:DNA polymerase I-like protein with 3'-5' exonuclease and polymerase domains
MPNLKIVIALGAEVTRLLSGLQNISLWRGSLLHPEHWPVIPLMDTRGEPVAPARPEIDITPLPPDVALLPSYDPMELVRTRDYRLIWWLRRDFKRAKEYIDGKWDWGWEQREYYLTSNVSEFERFVDKTIAIGGAIGCDTESAPYWVVSFSDEQETHSFCWDEAFRPAVTRLLNAQNVVIVAHNLNHDWTFFQKRLGFDMSGTYPFCDSMGLAHNLDPEERSSLSPHASTRFTYWPYHKWMSAYDTVAYCALDTACSFDIYWGAMPRICEDGLAAITQHDHRLQKILMEMQWRGVKVDEGNRALVEKKLKKKLKEAEDVVVAHAKPIVAARLTVFRKPHLFLVQKTCKCCGGGKKATQACWRCYLRSRGVEPEEKPNKSFLISTLSESEALEFASLKKAELEDALFVPCHECKGTGKYDHWMPLNVGSTSQMSDIIYRGLAIRPRTYMGAETLRYERLEPIQDKHPIIRDYITMQKIRAEFKTVERLRPGPDGRLHCVFDPFGTTSGRVACKEGLLEVGTNLMNLPYEARALIIPEPGDFILYPDMAQIEARCVAVLSQDPKLLSIYASGEDSHMEVLYAVEQATGFNFNSVSQGPHAGDGRQFAKRATYAFMYGIRAAHLSGELGVSISLAQQILDAMRLTFTGVQAWKDGIETEIFTTRYVRTPEGHQRRFLDRIADKKTGGLDYEVLKKGLSHKPQDMAAQILAEGLMKIHENHSEVLTPLLHIHDALVLSAALDNRHAAVYTAIEALSTEKWGMQFPADCSVGGDWYIASLSDKKKVEKGYGEWVLSEFLA